MTYGVARAATSPELVLYRKPKKFSKWRAAILMPRVIYRARINQTFSTTDSVLSLTFDGGSGTLANVLADMEMYVGSTLDAHDLGIVRVRSTDATHFYIEETSDIRFANDQYLTVVESFALRARHVLISSGVPYMDGGVAYSDQHSAPAPTPIMGSHRVLKLTGATVSTQFDWSSSYVIGGLSTITTYATSAPTASGISGGTTATPTVTFNTTGWHAVYLTVTAANTKSFFGVRWVYVWSNAAQPYSVQISDPRQDAESGGWEFEISGVDGLDLTTVPDRALVILFAEDTFDGTQSNIGPVTGSENVEVTGWIAKEEHRDDPEQPRTTFTVYTAHYWLGQIPAFPDGVELTTATPAAWTEFQLLTVDKGLWHMLHWRTTATRVMDVFLSGDTKYTAEVSSLASTLWEQIREMGWLQIYARPGCNAWNQLFIQVHPQLVPLASRDWPTVMTITKPDWRGEISLERKTLTECAVVSLSGVAVDSSGAGTSYFSLSPGHAYPHYGRIDVQDRLLVASQADANQKAGLYRGWQNNTYPDVPISLSADIRLIDCFPRSKCAFAIAAGDTPRAFTFSGNLLPTAVTVVTDPETGTHYREVSFEAETFEDMSVNGDIAGGRADVSIPPTPRLPPLPPFPAILPGTLSLSENGSVVVMMWLSGVGLVLAENFDSGSPTWRTINSGLSGLNLTGVKELEVLPNGSVYLARHNTLGSDGLDYFTRAPSVGGTFVTQLQATTGQLLYAFGVNKIAPEAVSYALATVSPNAATFYYGANGTYTAGQTFTPSNYLPCRLTYGLGYWLLKSTLTGYLKLSQTGTLVSSGSVSYSQPSHFRAPTGDIFLNESTNFHKITNNYAADNIISSGDGIDIIGEGFNKPLTIASDPTATYLMAQGLSAKKARSSDGGVTWVTIPNLPPGNWYFANAGDADRWIAISGTQIKYTQDFGDSWVDKLGNLLSISGSPNPIIARVVEF